MLEQELMFCVKNILFTDLKMTWVAKYIPSFAKRSRRTTNLQKNEMMAIMSESVINLDNVERFEDIHGSQFAKIAMEIGFGNGDFLLKKALSQPDVLFIGCEVYTAGIVRVLHQIKANNILNIRIFEGDARYLIEKLPDDYLSLIYILYPDPWSKSRHHKRRLIDAVLLDLIKEKSSAEAQLIIATDHEDYAKNIQSLLDDKALQYHENKPIDWISTKYEQKNVTKAVKHFYFSVNLMHPLFS